MVESSGLLNRRRALKLYRGFESLPLRQLNHLHSFSGSLIRLAFASPKACLLMMIALLSADRAGLCRGW